MTYLELIAITTGLLSVWYLKKENILVFPFGIISVLISSYVFFIDALYANSAINGYYFIMSVYGWINWKRKDKDVVISHCSRKENLFATSLFISSFLVIYYMLNNFTDSSVPLCDALTAGMFISAMWLMANKKIEHWVYWIIGDMISVPLFFYQELRGFSLLYAIYLTIAILGYLSWKRKIQLKELL